MTGNPESKNPESDLSTDTAGKTIESPDELMYEEPPAMTMKDNLGVAFALVALAVIGFLGYLWLTPGKSIATVFSKPESAVVEESAVAGETETATVEHQKCATCGMFADKSASHVVVEWTDGSTTHHDSWDCAFGHIGTMAMEMAGVEISHYGSPVESPHFLDATQAWYLYDTEARVEGSMPPFVAAFSSKDETESKLGEMGGVVVDYAGLAAKWDVSGVPAPVDHSAMDMDVHQMDNMDMTEDMPDASVGHETLAATDSQFAPQNHDHEMNCSYCGMFADKSQSHISVTWQDGSHTHHDCWDCMFFYGSENGLGLASVEVSLLDSPLGSPDWINAEDAWYLYDMDKSVPGSMPPFVGAFADKDDALAYQDEWGGEIVDFHGLKAKWN